MSPRHPPLSMLLVAAALVLAAACNTPCAMLAERLCACDLTSAQNQSACELARDGENRTRSERIARQTGVDPQRVCREALRRFHCPSEKAATSRPWGGAGVSGPR